MEKFDTAVVGGGAAGICAAINTARRGQKVIICEKMPQMGKKLLATGNGRCNLLNEKLDESFYNPAAQKMVKAVFEQYGKEAILKFFAELGLKTRSQDGRIFPITNQASSVLKVLDLEMRRLDIPVELEFDCNSITFVKNSILVTAADKRKVECGKVIITGGGKTYPALGSDGSIYKVTRRLGYAEVEPVPVVVPLVIKDRFCTAIQGQKIEAKVRCLIDGQAGPEVEDEVLFTAYGLSGSAILDISTEISLAINRQKKSDVAVVMDLVPGLTRPHLKKELTQRMEKSWAAPDMLVGILPNRISQAFKDYFVQRDIDGAIEALKGKTLKVNGTRGWNEAEFTSGGIDVTQINPATLESKIHGGVFFAGEVLDVNGKRGGYNLAWAWASGLVAGKS
jgi:predicted Rossmann fold flavoprotein